MNVLKLLAALSLCLFFSIGCSEKTKQEGKEALDATGEAIGAAAEDTKENFKKAGEVGEAAVDKAKEEFSGDDEPAAEPATVDGEDAAP
jgi:hypothetical protein